MTMRWINVMVAVLLPTLAAGLWAQETPEPAPTPAPAPAGAPHAMADVLAALPNEAQSFFAISDMADVSAKMAAFAQRTGINLPLDQPSVAELVRLRTGVQAGLSPRGAAAIVFLDSDAYKDRNTLFLLPVPAAETFLEYNSAREIEKGLYQITGQEEPRFFSFRGGYAVFSNSLRTGRAVRDGDFGKVATLSDDQARTAAGSDVFAHINLRRTLESRKDSSERFRRTVATKILGDPTLQSYSDLLLGYMVAVNELFEQLEVLDLGLTFGAEDLGVSLMVKFADGGSIFQALQNVAGPEGSAMRWLPLDQPVVSSGAVSLSPDALRAAAVKLVEFILQNSPQSQKSVQPKTRKDTIDSVAEFMNQLTGEIATMSVLPDPASGAAEAGVTILGVRDMQKFAAARDAVFGNLLRVGKEVGSRVTLSYLHSQERYRDVPVDVIRPHIAFTSKQYERLFEERAQKIYGPDGFIYRLALLEDRVVICTGSDQRLFHAAIDMVLDNKPVAAAPQIEKARATLPAKRNVEYYFNLSAVLSRSITLAGTAQGAAPRPITLTDEDRAFLTDQTLIGLAVGIDNGCIRADSRLGYQQLANAMAFIQRHLPPVTTPEPTPEPKPEEPAPEEPKVTPEPPAEPATPPTSTPEPAANPPVSPAE